jgi:hypothetical protein
MKGGLDPQAIYDGAVSTATASRSDRVPRILKRDFAPGGTVDISFRTRS